MTGRAHTIWVDDTEWATWSKCAAHDGHSLSRFILRTVHKATQNHPALTAELQPLKPKCVRILTALPARHAGEPWGQPITYLDEHGAVRSCADDALLANSISEWSATQKQST